LSVLYFYRRIFCTGKAGLFDYVSKVMIGLTIAWTISFFFALLFRCGTSFYAAWGSINEFRTKCLFMEIQDGLGISDFLFDCIILALPIPKVCNRVDGSA